MENLTNSVKNLFINAADIPIPIFLSEINNYSTVILKNFDLLINEINSLDENKFRLFYMRSSNDIKIKMIENPTIFLKIISAPKNNNGKDLIDLSDEEIKLKILSYPHQLKQYNPSYFFQLIRKLPNNLFEKATVNFDFSLFFNSIDDIKYYVKGKYKIDDNLTDSFITKINNKSRNPYYLLKLDTQLDFIIFNKFNLILNSNKQSDNIDTDLNIDIINKVNEKHMNLIIEKIKKMNNNMSDYHILITALNMYSIFGFDNTSKIIDNKFTKINEAALKRAATTLFIDNQRQYRIEHQDHFVSYEVVEKAAHAIKNNDIDFFKTFFVNDNNDYITDLLDKLKSDMNSNEINPENKELIKSFLLKEVNKREQYFKKMFIDKYISQYYDLNKIEKTEITSDELYNFFKDIDISKINFDDNGRPILNNNLINFLLGNLKNNNDCILRLVINKQAFGLNDTIDIVINNFNKIEKIISNSNNRLSINSMLDVIEVSKILFYHLEPNEQDLTLATIAKIMKSQKYCNESKEEILKRSKELHAKRKFKISSTIPIIEKSIKNNIKYCTIPFDSPSLIVSGIDTQSCLKVSGKGEEFLEYCMTNKNSMIVGLWDEKNNFYTCPFIRNGNTIYGNGIDPEPENEEIAHRLLDAIKEMGNKIIERSNSNEKIEAVIITDLNIEKFLNNENLKSISIDENIFIDGSFYADYHKEDIKNYIITSVNNVKINHYKPTEVYYQNRIPNYIYDTLNEKDKERINQIINSIYYDNINFKNIPNKNKEKRNYKPLNVSDYSYIIGNKDWFIAIDDNANIISCCLPYDHRAKNEYLTALSNIKNSNYIEERKR
ncbi:MAG TPA: hypothetical protein GX747_00120 [Tenericutes bacterium]|nr:hypothetical protein [Mycoplasmatota bacterium]